MIKGSIHHDDRRIRTDYEPNDRASEKLTADKTTVIAGSFNIPLSIINRTSRQNISKDTEDLIRHNLITGLITHRASHPTTAGYMSFPSTHAIFAKKCHRLVHEIVLKHLKEMEF